MKLKNCNAEQFIRNLKGRKVVCFGAGGLVMNYEVNRIDHLEKHIAFFVDNDKNKQDKKFAYLGCEFDVKSIDALKSINAENYIILITCTFYIEIYNQLKTIPELRNTECYMYDIISSYPHLDVENFFAHEIIKKSFKDWKQVLTELNLKNKHKGKRCFVIGNGPSLTAEDLELLQGEITFAANRIFNLFDRVQWRPTYFFCADYALYGADHREINKIDAELRFVPLERALEAGEVYSEITYYNRGANCIEIKDGRSVWSEKTLEFSENIEDIVCGGPTVMYDILQVAVYMGFSEIYLLGVDCNYKLEVLENGAIVKNDLEKDHFDEDYGKGLKFTPTALYARRQVFQKVKEVCEHKGIIIKNATRGGKLEVFERVSLEELIG